MSGFPLPPQFNAPSRPQPQPNPSPHASHWRPTSATLNGITHHRIFFIVVYICCALSSFVFASKFKFIIMVNLHACFLITTDSHHGKRVDIFCRIQGGCSRGDILSMGLSIFHVPKFSHHRYVVIALSLSAYFGFLGPWTYT
ncbi:hypothetical protein BC629DRAFT_1044802 [Irpex lacteus]|nr:hypothetical protein BC629DRAFT_1044802 [Irpex lacteus]